jgi:bifunctional DNA-binding transcriptional regulator/antitoxin component of YhaV-PrlF toxin-antitoxin module
LSPSRSIIADQYSWLVKGRASRYPIKEMTTTLSPKGNVTLPEAALTKLGLRPGARLDCFVAQGKIVLTPKLQRHQKVRIGKSKVTGLPAIIPKAGAPLLTSENVREALAEFP